MAKTKVQEYLPGIGKEKNERVHKAGLELLDIQVKLNEQKKAFKEQHERCIQIMRDEKITRYVYDRLRLILSPGKDKVAAKMEKDKKPRVKKRNGKKAAD